MSETSCTAAVIGGGPAGLMAAEVLAAGGRQVRLFEAMPSVGRKLLMAGRGGLNLTHSENLSAFLSRYGAAAARLQPAIAAQPPAALRDWARGLGQETFVGSSGRVFPRAMKASPLLRAWLARLAAAGVSIEPRHRWRGWEGDNRLLFETAGGVETVAAEATVLALGGASWPRLGATGDWVPLLEAKGIAVAPLLPANCGFTVGWSAIFARRFAGQPLKRIAVTGGGATARGEALITAGGIEGGAIYALSGRLRDTVHACGEARLTIDLRPDMSAAAIAARLEQPRGKQSLATFLRKAMRIAPAELGLLHEAAPGRIGALAPADLAALIKAVPVVLTGTAGIERAISTAGGIRWEEVDAAMMLRRLPGVFVAGEMLDWEAPTGGYLLQAAFATGACAGRGALEWLAGRRA